ncbi:MAG TPA: GH1 family beta-glucosidase [Longimicrobiales bacterium]
MSTFPDGFLWGAATSAYQIEGAAFEDGKGPSIWDRFSHVPGNTRLNQNADRACDHYHRYREDLALMERLGLQSYRFSISWPRVLPEGRGTPNRQGLDFYAQLVDGLLERGMVPNATLYHWDLPAALGERGGWLNPDIAGWFADYAALLYRALGDRVPLWATLNEPWVVMDAGYVHGVHAPGVRDWRAAPQVAHNLLRAHATAVQAFRAESKQRIGLVVNLEPKYPASDSPADLAAVARADAYFNRHFLDPVLFGSYPDELRDIFGSAWREPDERDMALIREPIDFLGINYYKRSVTCDDPQALPVREGSVPQPQHVHTELGWEVYPAGLTRILTWVHERYGRVPLYITENGAAFADPDSARGGEVHDPQRIAYLRAHIEAAHDAIAAGVDVRGYYVWSLLDNYEWAEGFTKRFGLVHVDFATLARTPKSSAHFYSDVVRSNGAVLSSMRER